MYHKRLSGYAGIGYTTRGDKNDHASENSIFGQAEYWDTFSMDIFNAKKEVLIASPYLHTTQVKRFLKQFPQNVHLTVVTGDGSSFKAETWEKVSNAVNILEAVGATVILQPKVYHRYAVIDKELLWYGGINFLGFEKTPHGAMRLCNTELAKELLDKCCAEKEMQMEMPGVR